MTLKVFVVLLLAMQLTFGAAAAPVIGVATARGSFRIDNAPVTGNGTLIDGATIETAKVASEVELTNGERMTLGLGSRGRVFRDRLVLERGESEFRTARGSGVAFGVEARSLRVTSEEKSAVGQVTLQANNRIHVAAFSGVFSVRNAAGTLIASVPAGSALEFEPQAAGAAAPSRLSGCVVKRDGHYFLTDETTNVTVELKGAEVEKYPGHRMEITGSQIPGESAAGSATQVIQVSDWKDNGKKCSAGVAGKAGKAGAAAAGGAAAGGAAAGGAGTAATVAGIAIGTKAIIAGVIVAAAATGTGLGVAAKVGAFDSSISQ